MATRSKWKHKLHINCMLIYNFYWRLLIIMWYHPELGVKIGQSQLLLEHGLIFFLEKTYIPLKLTDSGRSYKRICRSLYELLSSWMQVLMSKFTFNENCYFIFSIFFSCSWCSVAFFSTRSFKVKGSRQKYFD